MQNRIALVVLALAGTLTYFANSTMSVPGTDESSTRAATSLVDEDVADRGAQEQQLRGSQRTTAAAMNGREPLATRPRPRLSPNLSRRCPNAIKR